MPTVTRMSGMTVSSDTPPAARNPLLPVTAPIAELMSPQKIATSSRMSVMTASQLSRIEPSSRPSGTRTSACASAAAGSTSKSAKS